MAGVILSSPKMAAIGRVSALANLKNVATLHNFRGTICRVIASGVVRNGCCSLQLTRSRYFTSFKGVSEVRVFRPVAIQGVRHYAELPDLTFAQIEERILGVLKLFDKVNPDKLTLESHFINDLGLDSLDVVEIVMAIEDEFALEIPDNHAEKLFTPKDLVEYIADKTETFE
ncbi:acyl carrier protein, mitochondrial-like [Acanthaster planci]|uniref:Acyl carrier protein n=1 Tax=Acanthaster planci TaxID=133434 RepID=A0A8B7YHE1_ACAPL|nr:acyl carrier protein, mitochondrial-like [Acanthaster planci]